MTAKLTVKRVTQDEVNAFFSLDSPGYFIARDAEKAGEIAGAANAIEIITLVNKLYEIEFRNRIIRALAETHGKDAVREYAEKVEDDAGTDFLLRTLGKAQLTTIMKATADYVKQEAGVGKNDPTKEALKARSAGTRRRERR